MKGFKLIEEQFVDEVDGNVSYFEHEKTGAKLLQVKNDDDNKVFGVSFKTPVSDSAGVAHILEHSVLAGSKKYPLKEPFMELVKSSLNTYLNASTYPDKTVYPVASQNEKDFTNLVSVYLDSVFSPLLKKDIFKQEGWHYELEKKDGEIEIQGVVYNEMKGAFSDPMDILYEFVNKVLFDKCSYRHSYGGNPKNIPELTYEMFLDYHKKLYHPSNALIYFYGDYPDEKQEKLLSEYLDVSDRSNEKIEIDTQAPQASPEWHEFEYDPGEDSEEDNKGMCLVNWLLNTELDTKKRVELIALDYMLLSSSSSPLRVALLESGLGESVIGGGLQTYLKQLSYSVGLKGIKIEDTKKLHKLVLDTLEETVKKGFSESAKKAMLNTIEFSVRENNTGSTPRGLVLMLNTLSTWMHGASPFDAIKYEDKLAHLKEVVAKDGYFENLLSDLLVKHKGDVTVVLKPKAGLQAENDAKENEKTKKLFDSLSDLEKESLIEDTKKLKEFQKEKDKPEDLKKLPVLNLDDLKKEIRKSKSQVIVEEGISYHTFSSYTKGISYVSLAFDIKHIESEYLVFLPILSSLLFDVNTKKRTYLELSELMDIETGGTGVYPWVSATQDGSYKMCYMLRGKVLNNNIEKLFDIWSEVINETDLSDKDRVLQLVKQRKARIEGSIVPSGHQYALRHLNSKLSLTGWIQEQWSGIAQLSAVRELENQIETNWGGVKEIFNTLLIKCFQKKNLATHITANDEEIDGQREKLKNFVNTSINDDNDLKLNNLEDSFKIQTENNAFIIPARVHYVSKAFNLYESSYKFHGSMMPISNQARGEYLLNKVRIMGGAYGCFSSFNRFTGIFACTSYRDPNFKDTLDVYDALGKYLTDLNLEGSELDKTVIGVIGSLDTPELPDAEGSSSFVRHLIGVDDTTRQNIRNEVLNTKIENFNAVGAKISDMATKGIVSVIGPEETLKEAEGFKVQSLF